MGEGEGECERIRIKINKKMGEEEGE
jgi:hypothetical protein